MAPRGFTPTLRGRRRLLSRAPRAVAVALALAVAAATPAFAQTLPGAPAKAPKIDRDGDKVFEELERRLEEGRGNDRVDVIVTLEDSASAARVKRLERRVGAFDVRDRFEVVDGFAARVTKAQVRALAGRPGVVAVETDAPVRALNKTGSDAFGVTEARIDNRTLDGNRYGGRGYYHRRDLVAAVLDTGIDTRHRDLDEGKVLAFAKCLSSCVRRSPYDDHGHGTHVAGTLAGEGDARSDRRYRGVAPAAALVGVKVLNHTGGGAQSSVIRGIEWTIANRRRYGIEAINLSLGGGVCSDGTDALSRAANRAARANLVVVAAAGNNGHLGRCSVEAPAAASRAIAVGWMLDLAHGGFLSSWKSARGQLGWPVKPDVMGPGQGVISARYRSQTGYTAKSGTSSAAPFVTGVALLMRDASPAMTATTVKRRIKAAAVDWGPAGADIDFGAGRLDAYRALQKAGATNLTTPPRVPAHRLFEDRLDGPGQERTFTFEVKDRCWPIAASMVVVPWTAYDIDRYDFDVELLDPDGVVVARGDSLERQDDVTHRPARTGTYTLRVRSMTDSRGGDFFADLSAGLAAPPVGAPLTCSSP